MRRALSLTLLLLLLLTACGGGSGEAVGNEVRAEDGYAEARAGDLVHSYFMDFTVNGAYTTAGYHGHTAPEGMKVLVVSLTVKNTFNESLPMYDDDFQGQWTASADTDEFAWPITEGEDGAALDTVSGEQLPAEYELAVNESRTGDLVFDVPAGEKDFSISHLELFDDNSEGEKDFSISHLELFDDNSEGDTFFVFFTAEDK